MKIYDKGGYISFLGLPRSGWFRMIEMYCLTALGPKVWNQSGGKAMFPLRLEGRIWFRPHSYFLAASVVPWLLDAHLLLCLFILTTLCVSMFWFLFYKDISHIILRHTTKNSFKFDYLCKDLISKCSHFRKYWGL